MQARMGANKWRRWSEAITHPAGTHSMVASWRRLTDWPRLYELLEDPLLIISFATTRRIPVLAHHYAFVEDAWICVLRLLAWGCTWRSAEDAFKVRDDMIVCLESV
jgi:hypothetical protein